MSAFDDIVAAVEEADKAFDAFAGPVGLGEYTALADLVAAFLARVRARVDEGGTTLAAQVAAIDVEVAAREDAKVGK